MERPSPDDESDLRPDVAPGGDGERDPKPELPIVTPLDDGKRIKQGIEVKET